MARLEPTHDSDLYTHKTLFQHFLPRYLRHPAVRQFLMHRAQPPLPTFSSALSSSFSYACMYFPPSSTPRSNTTTSTTTTATNTPRTTTATATPAPHPLPQPFLDIGDFMLCDNVYDGIAVGHLYNRSKEYALAALRNKMLHRNHLSRTPVARKFAVDLTVPNLEIIEFAWMADHSLVISCRRFDPTAHVSPQDQLVLSGDLLFYDVIPQGSVPGVPLLRMTLSEKPAICQFCGTRGIKTCDCPSSFKTRAPSASTVPIPFSHSQFAQSYHNMLQIIPQGPLAAKLATWECFTKRIFNAKASGSFFVNWYKKSNTSSGMKLFMSPPHPISYQFVSGTRMQTSALACMYIKRLRLCERACSADARLYAYLSRAHHASSSAPCNQASSFPASVVPLDHSKDDLYFGMDDTNPARQNYHPPPSSFESGSFDPSHGSSSSILSQGIPDSISDDLNSITAAVPPSVFEAQLKPSIHEDPVTQHSEPLVHAEMVTPIPADPQNLAPVNVIDCDILFESLSPVTPDKVADFKDTTTIMENASNAWTSDLQREVDTLVAQNARNQRLTLSVSSREIQQYMTVDASNTPTCKQCGSSFPKRGNLARHIQTVHLKLKPFQCEQCFASFGYKNHLKRHQIVHQRAKELKCHVCSRVFKGQAQLQKHVRQAHKPSTENKTKVGDLEKARVSCDLCGVSFSQKSNLSRHMLIHEDLRFVCPVCSDGTSFGQRYDLHRHIIRKHADYADSAILSIVPQKVERVV